MDQGRKQQNLSLFDQLDSKISFNDLIAMLVANKWLIALSASVCLLFAIHHAATLVPVYSADLLVQIQDTDRIGSLGKASVPSLLGGDAASQADTQSVLIKSPYILGPVIKKMGLDLSVQPNYFPFFGAKYAAKHEGKLTRPFLGLSHYAWGGEQIKIDEMDVPPALVDKKITLVVLKNQQYQLFDLNKNLLLTGTVGKTEQAVLPNSGILISNISLLNANPGTHFFIFKGDTKSIIDSLADQIKISDLGAIEQIAARTGILQISLIGTNPQYIVSLLNTVVTVAVQKDIAKKSDEMVKTLAFLNKELSAVKKSVDQATLAVSAYQAKTGVMDIGSATTALMSQIANAKTNLYKIQLKKSMELEKFTPIHPYIQMLDAQEKEARDHLDTLKAKEQKLPMSEREGAMLLNDAKIKGDLYLILLNKIQSMQVVQAGTESDIQVLSYAKIPDAPIPVNKFKIYFSAIMLGAGAAIFFIIFKNLIYSKISDPDDIESQYGLKNMAIIPYSNDQEKITQAYSKHELLPLVAKVMPRSMPIEALRSFRTSLKVVMMDSWNNVITISGVSPGVGKSFVSANTAFILADSGKKVLLIDADMRKGHLKNYFRLGDYPGLSDLLSGKATVSEALVKNAFPDLDFIATGAYPENASELLTNQNYKKLIDHLSPLYDLIIIDTPPILAVTDAAIIAEHSGANFLVIGSGVHEKREVDLALKRFSASNITINGYIFNINSVQKGIYRQQVNTYNYQYEYK